MKSTNELLKQVEYLHALLEDYATGGARSNDSNKEYTEIRQELIKDKAIKDNLPKFILECRNLGYFWDYIKHRFGRYAERRDYLREEFSPLYNFLEECNASINRTDAIVTDLFKHQFPIVCLLVSESPMLLLYHIKVAKKYILKMKKMLE